jgi:hypothetical protein
MEILFMHGPGHERVHFRVLEVVFNSMITDFRKWIQ